MVLPWQIKENQSKTTLWESLALAALHFRIILHSTEEESYKAHGENPQCRIQTKFGLYVFVIKFQRKIQLCHHQFQCLLVENKLKQKTKTKKYTVSLSRTLHISTFLLEVSLLSLAMLRAAFKPSPRKQPKINCRRFKFLNKMIIVINECAPDAITLRAGFRIKKDINYFWGHYESMALQLFSLYTKEKCINPSQVRVNKTTLPLFEHCWWPCISSSGHYWLLLKIVIDIKPHLVIE